MSKNLNPPQAYFVTLSTVAREPLLGAIKYDATRLSPEGEIVQQCWHELPEHFPNLSLDVLAILPDHVHAIFLLRGNKPNDVAEIVHFFKDRTAKAMHRPVWQIDEFTFTIHNDQELFTAREFVVNNAHRKHTKQTADQPAFVTR